MYFKESAVVLVAEKKKVQTNGMSNDTTEIYTR